MSYLGCWLLLACVVLGFHSYSIFTTKKDKHIFAKEMAFYGFVTLGVLTIGLDKTIFDVRWVLDFFPLDWGWELGAKDLFYIVLIFACSLFFKDRLVMRWVLPVLSSLVILSTGRYQVALIFSILSYSAILSDKSQSKFMIFPSALLILVSYEKIWETSHLLSLSEYIGESALGLLVMGIIASLYLFHIINLVRLHKTVRPVSLILISLTQYSAFRLLSPYYFNELIICLIIFISILWLFASLISLLSRSQCSIENTGLKLYIVQLSIPVLLPVTLDYLHYIVLGLGLLPLLISEYQNTENKRPILNILVATLYFVKSIIPVSWLFILPMYELGQTEGLNFFAIFVLYTGTCIFSLINLSKFRNKRVIEKVGLVGLEYIVWPLKFAALLMFYTLPISLLLSEKSQLIFGDLISSPIYWLYFLMWVGYLFYLLFFSTNNEVIFIESYLKNSNQKDILELASQKLVSIGKGFKRLCFYTLCIIGIFFRVVFDLVKNIVFAGALVISSSAQRLSLNYELVSISFIGIFFVYFMWRYGI